MIDWFEKKLIVKVRQQTYSIRNQTCILLLAAPFYTPGLRSILGRRSQCPRTSCSALAQPNRHTAQL